MAVMKYKTPDGRVGQVEGGAEAVAAVVQQLNSQPTPVHNVPQQLPTFNQDDEGLPLPTMNEEQPVQNAEHDGLPMPTTTNATTMQHGKAVKGLGEPRPKPDPSYLGAGVPAAPVVSDDLPLHLPSSG